MLSRLSQVSCPARYLTSITVQPCRQSSNWDKYLKSYSRPFRFNKAAEHLGPNDKFRHHEDHRPEHVYWRTYRKGRPGPREYGMLRMDFSGYDQAIAQCQNGMVNVATMPLRRGEYLDTSTAPPMFEKGDFHQKMQQDKEEEKWRWFLPKLLPTDPPVPPNFFSPNIVLVKASPGASLQVTTALQLWKKEGRTQMAVLWRRALLAFLGRYQMWYHVGGFKSEEFLQEAVNTYILAHQAARDQDYEKLKDTVLEMEGGALKERFSHYRQLWRCWSVTEKPKIMGRHCTRAKEFSNMLIAQVFVRLKTREEHVAYNRLGMRVDGEEGKLVDKDQVVIFERVIDSNSMNLRCWRVLEIFPASEIETWKPRESFTQD